MKDLEENLVAHYYGEASQPREIDRLLTDDASARREFEELSRTLDAVRPSPVPEVGAAFSEKIWERIRWRLDSDGREVRAKRRRRLRLAAAACLLLGGFAASYLHLQTSESAEGLPIDARQRLLLLAAADHFDRSHLLLTELMNAPDLEVVDVSKEKERAAELLAENRIYQQSARHGKRYALALLLEEIERVLIEVRNGPDHRPRGDLGRLQGSVESQGLLFKIQVVLSADPEAAVQFEESL